MTQEDQDNFILKKEMESLNDDAVIAIVQNEEETDVNQLQMAWEILEKRGLKENVLSKIEEDDDAKKLSIGDLLHPENEEAVSDTSFADKIDFVIGSEIHANQRDMLGVYKSPLAKEIDLDIRTTSGIK